MFTLVGAKTPTLVMCARVSVVHEKIQDGNRSYHFMFNHKFENKKCVLEGVLGVEVGQVAEVVVKENMLICAP